VSAGFPVVVIGCSWGGLEAMSAILEGLPDETPAAVIIVQHRMDRPSELQTLLANHTSWPVCEADDKEGISPRRVYLAPPGYHTLVDGDRFALSTEAPVRNSRPSIDVLMESIASSFGPRAIGVVLTGANDDGARGLAEIVRHGGAAIVQDPETAQRRAMPEAALTRVPEAEVAPLSEIGHVIVARVRERSAMDPSA
jgi:two-component system chemotaxis response regulator CheB